MNNNTIEPVSTNSLYFDFKNPRIAEFNYSSQTPENEIIQTLWEVMGVEEIVLSIKASGFFDHEPLIAVKEDGKIIVIEGNRRLAAVKCLIDPDIADFIGINKNILKISEELKQTLNELPVLFVDSRKDAWKFIGFKHINGPAKWGSYAKAQYISQIKNEFDIPLSEIASQIGDTHKTVEKLYQGLQVIEQAEKMKIFDRTDVKASRLYFSHLYTGLTYQGLREFIGLENSPYDTKDPVPKEKKENLEQLLFWIYGSKKKEIEPVIVSQNPDLRRLEAVIRNSEATFALKDGVSLISAYEISQPKRDTFEQSLLEAKRSIAKAHSYQPEAFNGNDMGLLKTAGTVADMAEQLYKIMEAKYNETLQKQDRKKRITEEE